METITTTTVSTYSFRVRRWKPLLQQHFPPTHSAVTGCRRGAGQDPDCRHRPRGTGCPGPFPRRCASSCRPSRPTAGLVAGGRQRLSVELDRRSRCHITQRDRRTLGLGHRDRGDSSLRERKARGDDRSLQGLHSRRRGRGNLGSRRLHRRRSRPRRQCQIGWQIDRRNAWRGLDRCHRLGLHGGQRRGSTTRTEQKCQAHTGSGRRGGRRADRSAGRAGGRSVRRAGGRAAGPTTRG
ncbi:hypothetical protein FsymDg_1195 [Candidatus Protofrankia datiscae]|uniref:Uncharacterized protein n=1 Tax=Candidatus Protofrankia datiscae TaxID=2716812 RepID=F8B2K8_9ACTN|nr:hypothetical protein FsymDg_1195 [Candidatus Protofrankia datiscae]